MVSVDAVANYVRHNYSAYGAEVGAVGQRSITVSLPQDMPVTRLVAELWNTYGATVEIKHAHCATGASLVIWLDSEDHTKGTDPDTLSNVSWWQSILLVAVSAAVTSAVSASGVYSNVTFPLNVSQWIVAQ